MYHVLKDLIETTTSSNDIYEQEMVWLIKEWYHSDRKLRDLIPLEEIRSFDKYSIENDPLENYKKRTGDSVFWVTLTFQRDGKKKNSFSLKRLLWCLFPFVYYIDK